MSSSDSEPELKPGDFVRVRDDALGSSWVDTQVRNHGYLWLVVGYGIERGAFLCKSIATGHETKEVFFRVELEKADV